MRSILLAACLVLGACTGPTGATTSPSLATPSPTPVEDFIVGGDRPVTVYVPDGLDPGKPAPILVFLHGFGGTGLEYEPYVRFRGVAADKGLLYLHPDGTRDQEGAPFWNATDACCNRFGSEVDDSAYLAGLIAEIATHVAVDARRVYFVGHSNGGFMSHRMACDHADVIAAIVSIAGASFKDVTACRPSNAVSILQIQGSLDDQVKPEGGHLGGDLAPGDEPPADYPSTIETLEAWAGYNDCASALTLNTETLDLDATLGGKDGQAETAVSAVDGCPEGGSVELWLIDGGAHDPQWTPNFGATVIDYLLAHPKPA